MVSMAIYSVFLGFLYLYWIIPAASSDAFIETSCKGIERFFDRCQTRVENLILKDDFQSLLKEHQNPAKLPPTSPSPSPSIPALFDKEFLRLAVADNIVEETKTKPETPAKSHNLDSQRLSNSTEDDKRKQSELAKLSDFGELFQAIPSPSPFFSAGFLETKKQKNKAIEVKNPKQDEIRTKEESMPHVANRRQAYKPRSAPEDPHPIHELLQDAFDIHF